MVLKRLYDALVSRASCVKPVVLRTNEAFSLPKPFDKFKGVIQTIRVDVRPVVRVGAFKFFVSICVTGSLYHRFLEGRDFEVASTQTEWPLRNT